MKHLKLIIVAGVVALIATLVFAPKRGGTARVDDFGGITKGLIKPEDLHQEEKQTIKPSENEFFNFFAFVKFRTTSPDGLKEYVELQALDKIRIGNMEIPIRNHHKLFDENLQKEYFKYYIKAYPQKYTTLREKAVKGGSIEFKFTDSDNKELATIVLSASELNDLYNTFIPEKEAKEKILEIFATEYTSLMAGYSEDYVRFSKATYNGSSFIIEHAVDEKYIDMNQLKQNRKELEKDIKHANAMANLNQPSNGVIDDLLKDLNKSLIYRYRGNRTGKYIDINVPV